MQADHLGREVACGHLVGGAQQALGLGSYMKTATLLAIVIGLSLMGMAAMAGEASLVTLKTIGVVPTELSSRIASWVSEQIGPVTNAGVLVANAKTLDDVALSLAVPATSTALVTHVNLVLVSELKGESRRATAMKGVVVVHLAQLEADDKEVFARRVEKEAVGGVAFALGLPACQLFQCALYPAQSLKEVDQKARGLCPPCMGKLSQVAGSRGQ